MRPSIISLLLSIVLYSHSLKAENESFSKNIYDSLIQPVFVAKCQECHGENKSKGKLKLHTKEDFLKGGSGAGNEIVIKGNVEDSELIYRITLPKEDDEAMPPMEDKDHYNPITKQELDVMKAWISLGASFDLLVSDLDKESKNSALHVFQNMPKKMLSKTLALQTKLPDVPKANPEFLEKIREQGILAIPIAQNTNAIYVNASYAGENFNDEKIRLLEPIAGQILWLNLARTNISDKGISMLTKFKLLSRLHLENTNITDAATSHISKLSNLKYLNMYGTNISDTSIPHLKKLGNLKKVFLWQTKMTSQGAEKLKKHFVGEKIYEKLLTQKNTIQKSLNQLVKTEELKIEQLEGIKNQVGTKSSDKVSINLKCPVSEKELDDSYSSVFEGRKVGFCCAKCKVKFDKGGAVFRSKIKNFSASKEFIIANKNLRSAQLSMDKKVELIQQKLRIISAEFQKKGPEINLGWEKPIATK